MCCGVVVWYGVVCCVLCCGVLGIGVEVVGPGIACVGLCGGGGAGDWCSVCGVVRLSLQCFS